MLKLQKLKGNPVYYQSDNGKVAVTYNMFGLGNRFTVYALKMDYGGNIAIAFQLYQKLSNIQRNYIGQEIRR